MTIGEAESPAARTVHALYLEATLFGVAAGMAIVGGFVNAWMFATAGCFGALTVASLGRARRELDNALRVTDRFPSRWT